MLSKFNQFIEKWMALVTPACLLFGVLFPDVAKHGLPYVSLVFAFMTFTGALKSDFHDMARVLKRPFPLLACLGVLHVLLPVLACGLGHLLFPGNDDLITGMVLEFSVPHSPAPEAPRESLPRWNGCPPPWGQAALNTVFC